MSNSTTTSNFIYGWVQQPNNRGTIDIIRSCIFTIFLCSWTVLCLNIPADDERFIHLFTRKARWMALQIYGPEILLTFPLGQWASARRSVQEFGRSGYPQWKSCHAFFADMGGVVLQSPDYPPFPVNAKQVHWLVTEGHMPYPDIDKNLIWDKNKADTLSRTITIVQTTWFFAQCIGRGCQGLPLTTFELATLAFVFCTLPTFFCWFNKPLDIKTPNFVCINVPIEGIREKAGPFACQPYIRTPLDFVDPTALYWSNHILPKMGLKTGAKRRPIERATNDKVIDAWGTWIDGSYIFISFSYALIHLAAWNFSFPTDTERHLWRIAVLVMLGCIAYHWLSIYTTEWSKLKSTAAVTSTAMFIGHATAGVAYAIARGYLLVEPLFALRALPAGAFVTVQWSSYWPHV